MDSTKGLQAVNGSTIPTYGTKTINIRLDKKSFKQEIIFHEHLALFKTEAYFGSKLIIHCVLCRLI